MPQNRPKKKNKYKYKNFGFLFRIPIKSETKQIPTITIKNPKKKTPGNDGEFRIKEAPKMATRFDYQRSDNSKREMETEKWKKIAKKIIYIYTYIYIYQISEN